MAIIGVDHVVIRVKDREEAIERYSALGLELSHKTDNPAVGKVAIFRLADGFFLELVAPLGDDSPIGKALESRGEGVHSIALKVDDFEASVEDLKARGAPVIKAEGLPLAFIHPKATPGAMLQIMEPSAS
jgi:methylmalonyl-CoA epimerase